MSTNVRFYLSHDMKTTYKSYFWRENVKIVPSFTNERSLRYVT